MTSLNTHYYKQFGHFWGMPKREPVPYYIDINGKYQEGYEPVTGTIPTPLSIERLRKVTEIFGSLK